jgi:hypothetical protein
MSPIRLLGWSDGKEEGNGTAKRKRQRGVRTTDFGELGSTELAEVSRTEAQRGTRRRDARVEGRW